MSAAVIVALIIGGLFLVLIGILFKLPIKKKRTNTDADKILVYIKQVIKKYPTLRVSQLIVNAVDTQHISLYYLEDADLLELLKHAYGK